MEDEDRATNIVVFLFYGLIILVAILILKFLSIDFGGDEIKAYSATCKTKVKLNTCDSPEIPLGITTYKISYSQQRVISDNGGLVNKYTDCTVKDRKNWHCSFDDKSGDFGFISGTFFNVPNWSKIILLKDSLGKTYYPTRFEYIDLSAKGCNEFYPLCYLLYVMTY